VEILEAEIMKEYRGRRIDNGEEVKGYFFRGVECTNGIETPRYHIGEDSYDSEGYHEVDPETVGQETGAKDKNNKEIFGSIPINGKMSRGGHIVRYMDGRNMEVFYSTNGYVGWHLKRKPNHGKGLLIYMLYNHKGGSGAEEIIGNQWDNPKLMKGD